MRHCGNVPSYLRGDVIYSLREPVSEGNKTYWKPHMTIVCHARRFRELKGFSNRKPGKELHPYIVDLLSDEKFKVLANRVLSQMTFIRLSFQMTSSGTFSKNPNFKQDDIDYPEETIEVMSSGWRWVFIPNTKVACWKRYNSRGASQAQSLEPEDGLHYRNLLRSMVKSGGFIGHCP